MSFIGPHRWLGRSHPYRRQKAAFNNHSEHSPAPVPLTGEEVLQRVEKEVPKYKFGRKNGPPAYKSAEDERTLLNIPGKTKDGVKTRLDLVEMSIRLGLIPNLEGSKKERLPLA
ncbi:hypothetical protein ACLB2K_040718 [Fragaria x ananassa]